MKATKQAPIYLTTHIETKSHNYKEMKMSYFLCSDKCEEIPIDLAKFITKSQSHMVEKI